MMEMSRHVFEAIIHKLKIGVGIREYERGKAHINEHYDLSPRNHTIIMRELAKHTRV